MLSNRYIFFKKLLQLLVKCKPLDRRLKVLAEMYMDIHKGFRFSYIADQNGETDFLDALSKLYLAQPFVFFDVGAHVGGYTTEITNRFNNYQGHLFDLSECTLDTCRAVHGNNRNLVINHLGLCDKPGPVHYRYYPLAQLQTAMMGVGPYVGHNFEIKSSECTTGDLYCATQGIDQIDLLKIDTEGYDLFVLKGFEKMLSTKRIKVIQFEYNIKSGETHCMLGDFYNYLAQYGYVIGPVRPEGIRFEDFNFLHNDFFRGPNYVACLPELQKELSCFKSFRTSQTAI